MLKLNKTNESGRSMVEMLGVLAIIGVLSVMGIAGYTVAMSSHHANEVLNQVNRMAILISAQRQLNGGVGSPTSEDTPYSVELDQSNTSKIVLTASNVPVGAAKRLEGMTLSVPEISVSGTTVTFTFENDLGEGTPTTPSVDCATFTADACNLSCTGGQISYASVGTLCGDDDETMQKTGRCDGQGHCIENWIKNDGSGCAKMVELCSCCSVNPWCKVYDGECTEDWYDGETGCARTQELCSSSLNSSCQWNGNACVVVE